MNASLLLLRRRLVLALALGVAVLATTALHPGELSAQESTVTIEVPDPAPDSAQDFFGERFAVFVDGVLCVEGDVPATGGFTIILGEDDQPSACREEGGLIELAGTQTGPMFLTMTFAAGVSRTFDNWAPYPTHTPYPEYVCEWFGARRYDISGCVPQVMTPHGMVLWQFAPRSVFADERVIIALVSLVDPFRAMETWEGAPVALAYGAPDGIPPANDDQVLLLRAAGVLDADGSALVKEARTCRMWLPEQGDLPIIEAYASGVVAELVAAFDTIGIATNPCEITTNRALADILFWQFGQDPPIDFQAPAADDSFLVVDGAPAPIPSAAGNAGLLATPEGNATPMLAAALAILVGARVIRTRLR